MAPKQRQRSVNLKSEPKRNNGKKQIKYVWKISTLFHIEFCKIFSTNIRIFYNFQRKLHILILLSNNELCCGLEIFRSQEKTQEAVLDSIGLIYPGGDTAFKFLLLARFCSAIWSHITDCDETYNYWEPVSISEL